MKKVFVSSLFKPGRLLPTRLTVLFAAVFAMVVAWSSPASADTLGTLFCNLWFNMGKLGDLFFGIAFIGGTFFMGYGLWELVRHHDNARERPLHHPLLKLIGGSALLAAPRVAQAVVNTLYVTKSKGTGTGCSPGAVTSTAGGVTLDVLIENLVGNIKGPFVAALSVLAIVAGIYMLVRGLMKASKYGVDPRSHSITHIVSNLAAGAVLIVIGQTMDTMLGTVFGGGLTQAGMQGGGAATGQSVVTNWNFVTQLNPGVQFINAVAAALMFFQLIGMIAFVRGWMILKNYYEGSGQATMAQGITHIIGGALALNVFNFLEIMDTTFGTNFLG